MQSESSDKIDWSADTSEWWDPDLVHDGEKQPRWYQAAGDVDFQLSYRRSEETRVFDYSSLSGDDIDDVHPPHKRSVGSWSIGHRPPYTRDDTVAYWKDVYIESALQEAVHEALEYIRVDGEQWLNPHGEHDDEIMEEVERLVSRLRDLRAGVHHDD